MSKIRQDDLGLLLPSVRAATERVISRLGSLGYEALVFDTLRTPEEALRNARRGKGIVDSIHCYGAAVDLICADHLWSCEEKDPKTGKRRGCKFFIKLCEAVEAEGLVAGRRFPRVDSPHFQAIPIKWQDDMRALGMGPDSAEARDALCRRWLERKR